MVGKNWLKVLLIAVKKISINVKRQIFIASAKKPRVFQWVKSHWTWFLGVNHLLIECQKPEGGQRGRRWEPIRCNRSVSPSSSGSRADGDGCVVCFSLGQEHILHWSGDRAVWVMSLVILPSAGLDLLQRCPRAPCAFCKVLFPQIFSTFKHHFRKQVWEIKLAQLVYH